jgi:hypothetical protein
MARQRRAAAARASPLFVCGNQGCRASFSPAVGGQPAAANNWVGVYTFIHIHRLWSDPSDPALTTVIGNQGIRKSVKIRNLEKSCSSRPTPDSTHFRAKVPRKNRGRREHAVRARRRRLTRRPRERRDMTLWQIPPAAPAFRYFPLGESRVTEAFRKVVSIRTRLLL